MLGSLMLYLKGMRIIVFQLSGFRYIGIPANRRSTASRGDHILEIQGFELQAQCIDGIRL